jgi:hypothetical protein
MNNSVITPNNLVNTSKKMMISPELHQRIFRSSRFNNFRQGSNSNNPVTSQNSHSRVKRTQGTWFSNVFKSTKLVQQPQKLQQRPQLPREVHSQKNHNFQIPGFETSSPINHRVPEPQFEMTAVFGEPEKPNLPNPKPYVHVSNISTSQQIMTPQKEHSEAPQREKKISRKNNLLNYNFGNAKKRRQNSRNLERPQNHLNHQFQRQNTQEERDDKFSFEIGKTFGNFSGEFGPRKSKGYEDGIRQRKRPSKSPNMHQRPRKKKGLALRNNRLMARQNGEPVGFSSSREVKMNQIGARGNLLQNGFLPRRNKEESGKIGLFNNAMKKLGLERNRKSYYF